MKYIKDYHNWNKLKNILDMVEIDLPFTEGQIWWASLGVNIGIEIDGKGENLERPVIIVRKINKKHAWIVPITQSGIFKTGIHVPIYHPSLSIASKAIITQFRTISSKRLLSKIGIISTKQFHEIVRAIKITLPYT